MSSGASVTSALKSLSTTFSLGSMGSFIGALALYSIVVVWDMANALADSLALFDNRHPIRVLSKSPSHTSITGLSSVPPASPPAVSKGLVLCTTNQPWAPKPSLYPQTRLPKHPLKSVQRRFSRYYGCEVTNPSFSLYAPPSPSLPSLAPNIGSSPLSPSQPLLSPSMGTSTPIEQRFEEAKEFESHLPQVKIGFSSPRKPQIPSQAENLSQREQRHRKRRNKAFKRKVARNRA